MVDTNTELGRLIEQVLKDETEDSCFLVEYLWHEKTEKLVVYLDAEAGVTLAQCQKINRALGRHLEETELLGTNYALEVSSPGLERPLKMKRQYIKNVGRVLKVKTTAGDSWEGKLGEVDEEGILLVPESKKTSKSLPKQIAFADIEKTFVQARFK